MNYDTSLCLQHVYSLRAPIIGNIWLFRRHVSCLTLSNSTDVDSRDNSEYTRVCLYVMCDINVCSYSFICHLDVRLFVARWFHYLHPPPLCSAALPALCVQCRPVDSSVLSSVWTMVHLVQSMLWKWYFKLMSPLYSTAMWHLISVIFIDLHRFSVEKTQHFKFNGVNGYIPVLSIPWQKVREKWPKCQCPDEIMFWWEDNQGRKMLQNHFTLE